MPSLHAWQGYHRAGHNRWLGIMEGLIPVFCSIATQTPYNRMHLPIQFSLDIGLLLDRSKKPLPEAGFLPAAETAGYGTPGAVPLGQVSPGGTRVQDPQDAIQDTTVV